MSAKFLLPALIGLLAPAGVLADGCHGELARRLERYAQAADSLRPEKPGVAWVYAADGSRFSAPQALWMKAQVRAVEQACVRGDSGAAEQRLAGLGALLGTR